MASWIGSFVEHTSNIDSPTIFKQWAAISVLGAVLEQKVWLKSGGGIMYPNTYIFLIGHPGVGKTRTIRAAKSYLLEIKDFHLAPTSTTAAALVDCLSSSKRTVMRMPDPPLEYNTMMIAADELGTFVHKYDDEMIAVLSAFYDPDPYGHNRRGKDIKIKIDRPQLSILCGSTPSNLLKFLPEGAWEQGFTSRTMMVFSDERHISDDFAHMARGMSEELLHDLQLINTICGEFSVTEDYRSLVLKWRELGEQPSPIHPKLIHYNTRRRAHLYKLSMIAAIDSGDVLLLTRDHFNTALNWMVEIEKQMPEIFKAGAQGADAQAMEEIYHFMVINGEVPEHRLVRFASEKVPAHSVLRVIDLMERSGQIRVTKLDPKTQARSWKAVVKLEDRGTPQ